MLTLAQVHNAATVFCYVAHGNEVATRALIESLAQAGKQVFVPKIIDRRRMQAAPFSGWDAMQPGPLGIPAPVTHEPGRHDIDVTITPGLGFSALGDRLGFGAGYYDRWFEEHGGGHRIGLAYECQIIPYLPIEPFDVAMDTIVTQRRVLVTRS